MLPSLSALNDEMCKQSGDCHALDCSDDFLLLKKNP